jgi:hypothetical protein
VNEEGAELLGFEQGLPRRVGLRLEVVDGSNMLTLEHAQSRSRRDVVTWAFMIAKLEKII